MSKPIHFKGRLNRRGRKAHRMAIRKLSRVMVVGMTPPDRHWFFISRGL